MEIERKFLTVSLPFSLKYYPKKEISQCYLSFSPTIRLRRQNGAYILTVKGKGLMAREEFELPLSAEEYAHLLPKAEGQMVEKTRYLVPLAEGYTAEIDQYHGSLTGLWTTEVEFPSLEAATAFLPPDWMGQEVTNDPRYSNACLAQYGLPRQESKP